MGHSTRSGGASPSTMPKSDGGGETPLTDERLAAEIELLDEVIAGAAAHEGRLSEEEVDEVLGARGDGWNECR